MDKKQKQKPQEIYYLNEIGDILIPTTDRGGVKGYLNERTQEFSTELKGYNKKIIK